MNQIGLGAIFEIIWWILEGIQALLDVAEVWDWVRRKR